MDSIFYGQPGLGVHKIIHVTAQFSNEEKILFTQNIDTSHFTLRQLESEPAHYSKWFQGIFAFIIFSVLFVIVSSLLLNNAMGQNHYEVLFSFLSIYVLFGRFSIPWILYRLETKKSSREIEHA